MADFKETLVIKTYRHSTGNLSTIGMYNYAITKEDLSNGTFQIIAFEEMITLGDACKVIDSFVSSSLDGRKLAIRAFLEAGELTHSEEY